MKKFDTRVQELKYKVLREVASRHWRGELLQTLHQVPKVVVPGNKPTMRCCVYRERAIVQERIQLAIGGDSSNPNVVEVIDIACDECPMGGFEITNSCRGCIAHHCEKTCHFGAIYFDQNQKAHIDKSKCKECGQCAKVCPYNAISNNKRPCEMSCHVGAISMNKDKIVTIDNDKCISCGACVYQCPFGAIMDKSYILDAVDLLKQTDKRVYAVVAPSISSQFSYAKLGQVVQGLKEIGFHQIVEAALGADMVAYAESKELSQKDFLTSSCCPAFVSYVENEFPDLALHISHNLSPAAVTAEFIRKSDPDCHVIFIGPCIAKKKEYQLEKTKRLIDCTLTFEELQALFDSFPVDITALEDAPLNNASYYGRIFARSGGVSEAVRQALKEQNIDDSSYKPVPCNGIVECRKALMKAQKNVLDGNFIEGMACIDGCIGGAGCITHAPKDKTEVDKYGKLAMEKTIGDAIHQLRIIE